MAYDHYLYAAAALLGTFVTAWVLLQVLGEPRWSHAVAGIAGVVPPFINVLGVLFGLTLAFLANDTWNAHDRALAAVNREADALHAIAVLGGHLPAADTVLVDGAVRDYARAALGEWPMLSRRKTSPVAMQAADRLLGVLSDRHLATVGGAAAAEQDIALAMAVRDARGGRAVCARFCADSGDRADPWQSVSAARGGLRSAVGGRAVRRVTLVVRF